MQNRIDGLLLKSQQVYLKKLGFYSAKIDGFWGPKSKAAMIAYRESNLFFPASKRRGDGPFVPFEKLPKGYEWNILDGQRCIMEKNSLPASFAVQELVNLITKPMAVEFGVLPKTVTIVPVASVEVPLQSAKVDSFAENAENDAGKVSVSQFQKPSHNQHQKSDKK